MSTTPSRRPLFPPAVRRAATIALVGGVAIVVSNLVTVLRLRARGGEAPGPLNHDGVVGTPTGRVLTLVVLGDSAAAGHGLTDPDQAYPRQLARRLARSREAAVDLFSFAENGARIADITRQQVPRIPVDADLVVLSAGVNDALARRRPDQVRADTVELIVAVNRRVPDAEIVVVACPDLSTAPGFPWPLSFAVGWSCRRVRQAQRTASQHHPVTFVSYPEPPTPEMYGADGFHPGAAGQAVAADAVVAALGSRRD